MKSSAKKVELAPYDDLFSTEESRQDAKLEKIRQHRVSAVGNYATPFCDFSQKSLDGRGQ